MTDTGIGELVIIDGRMNSSKYISVLETALLPSFSTFFGDTNMDGVKFQHDNTSYHKSAKTKAWLQENSIEILDWPVQLSDLNPMEHLWKLLKQRIQKHAAPTKNELEKCLRQEWNAFDPKDCEKIVKFLSSRINAVIKAKGALVKY